jgi:ribose transport system permease protein
MTASADATASSGPSRPSALIIRYGEAYTLVIVMVIVGGFFSVWPATSETFPTLANLRIVVGNQAVLAILALAVFVPLVTGEFDLTVGANMGLASVFAASAMSAGVAWPAALVIALGSATLIGVVNGLLVTRAGVNSLISTLGVSIIVHGIVVWYTAGLPIVSNIPRGLTAFGSGTWLGIPQPTYILAAIVAVAFYVITYTPFGRYLYAIGSNVSAARLVGIDTQRVVLLGFVLSGVLAGLAAFVQIARAGGANPRVGESFTLPAMAAAFLSAASIQPGRYNVFGVVVAVFFLATLNSGLNLAGADVYVNDLVNGTALIVGVGLARFLGRRSG